MKNTHFISYINKPYPQQSKPDTPQNPAAYSDISQDPDYKLMLAESQQGHWNECKQLITILDEKYPGNSKIAGFKNDFELQVSIINNIESSAKEDRKKRVIHTFKILAITTGSIIGAILIIWYGLKTYQNNYQKKQLQDNANQISALSVQVESLLDSGQPEKAQELIQSMKVIDPTSPKINELSQKTAEIIKINNLYLDALDKLKNGYNSDALNTLTKIESEYPGYKDVPQLIESTNSKIKITQALSAGTEAYHAGKWQEAIDNFTQVLTLDPNNSDPNLKEMLTNSYLQPANQLIDDPAQTLDTINQAFVYIGKAASLNPQDPSLQAEVNKMILYRSGFSDYSGMNWPSAIQQLTALSAFDAGYANGFARQLLYEAHIGQGNQYFSAGSYPDAQNEYETAETLASGGDNLLRLYLTQINLGSTLGKMKKYDEADSHFNNAIQTSNYDQRGVGFPTFRSVLHNAVQLYQDGKFEDSYNLFYQTLVGNDSLYETKVINAFQGNCLALIATQYQSSVQAILEINNLPQQTIVPSERTLIIPSMP